MREVWNRLEENFSGWEIVHTGGGIFVARKDFPDKKNKNVVVLISEDVALTIRKEKNSNEFISLAEFKKDQGRYWEEAYELELVLMSLKNEMITVSKDCQGIFSPKVTEEIKKNFKKFGNFIWDKTDSQEN